MSVDLYFPGQVAQFLSKLDVTIFLDGSKSTHCPECIQRQVNANKNAHFIIRDKNLSKVIQSLQTIAKST